MANPFKDADKKKKNPPGGFKTEDQTPPIPEEPPVVTPEPASETSDPMVGKEFLSKFVEPKSEGKSCSFYLSHEAIKKLDKLAKQLKCSKSKALDILLRNAVE